MSKLRSLKSRLAEKGHILNGYCQMPGAFSAEVYARQGWDAVTLDLQHGLIGYESAVAILQAIAATDVIPLVRVPWLDPATIMKVLDAGALGVTCAMINTAEQADLLVRYAKYPPRGERSLGPIRAAQIYGADYATKANEVTNVFAMVETLEGLANIDAILAVEGLDGIYLGPGDLAMSMGKSPRQEGLDPEVDAAIEIVLRKCIAKNLIAGIIAPNPEHAWRMVQRGFKFVTLASDIRALVTQSKSWVDGFRRLSAS